jgi:hypothetical protein
MAFEQCIASIKDALDDGRTRPKTFWDGLEKDVERLYKKHKNLNAPNITEAVLDDIAKQVEALEIANKIKERNTALNTRKKIEQINYVRTVWGDRPVDGLRALLRSTAIARTGAGNSVIRGQAARADFLVISLYTNLSKNNLFKLFASGEFDVDIHRAMWKLDAEDGDFGNIRPEAVEMAREIRKINEYARQQANKHGAAIGRLDGFVTTRATDSLKVKQNADGWLQFMEENLDFERTLADVDPDLRVKKLQEMRTEFMANKHIKLDAPQTTSALTGFGSIGKSLSHERVLHFKTPEAEAKYAVDFGTGNLAKSVMFHLERLGADTAIMEHLGPNAKANFDAIHLELMKDAKKANDDPLINELGKYKIYVDRELWPHISGSSRGIENQLAAQASSFVAGIQQMASLGQAMLSMFSDIGITAAAVNYNGRTFLGGIAEATSSLLKGTPTGERLDILTSLGVLADGIKGSVIGRFTSGDMLPGQFASSIQTFFKYTGIQAWPDRIRNGYALGLSNWLASNTRHAFADLPLEVKRTLRMGGFDELTWDNVMRQSTREAGGKQFFVPEALDGIDDAAFAAVLKAQNVKPTKGRITALREELAEKTRSMFQDNIINAVVEGDAQTRAALVGGAGQGSWSRVIRGHVTMFKTFPIAVIEKPVARFLKGMDESGKMTTSGFIGLTKMLVTMTGLGYISMTAKDLVNNKTPRDPNDVRTWMAAFTQGGGAGLYGDFLFGEANRFGGGIISTLAGPTAGDISKLHDLYNRVRDGDDAAGKAFKFLVSNTPGNNVFYLKGLLDYMIVHQIQESLNPGYLRRMERRLERENEQHHFFPPSQR